ncbi:hypothetical protein O181_044081 [Austropuccinia psidii MF-1]|uniref:Uncharacterized protein n=1 Tax=Austropuccinia psidii MF-1 TaxID=1389203 RepID=A0A9Q3DPQ9_9BASI|nr:hypothetical protein [Austropuccinia psidii MF-1]
MSIISDPGLELSIISSKRYKSNSEGSDRHLHEPVQAVIHGVQGQVLGNVATNLPRSDELLEYPEKVPQRGGNSQIIQLIESTITQTSNQNNEGLEQQKEGGNKGRSPSSFYQKATSQPNSPIREEEKEK